jgi:organic radical activating enzyme
MDVRYKFMKGDNEIFISEIFYSIQGEGIMAGSPAIFIRTQGCNLNCIWCDTKDVWINGTGIPYDELVNKILELHYIAKYNISHIVITGGEPLLRQEELVRLLSLLNMRVSYFPIIEVETNGTIKPNEIFDKYVTIYNVSPKLSNSQVSLEMRSKPDVIEWFAKNKKAWFKFVVENESDVEEIIYDLPYSNIIMSFAKDRILLMPQADTREKYLQLAPRVIEWCKKYGFRFSPRLHIEIYDRRTGV